MDIAALGFRIDSSGLIAANNELDKLPEKAKRVEVATGNLANATKRAASTQKDLTSEAARTGYQLRMVGLQIPDVVQGLLSGQSAFQVLIQQGGQVVQLMGMGPGGYGGALKALMSPMALTIGGLLGVAGAAATLGIAMHKSAEEQIAFDNALLLTSHYAAASTQSLYSMADSIAAAATVSASSVRQIESQLVSSGRVGSQSLQELTQVVVEYAQATGTKATDAIKVFLPLMEDTTAEALKLNDQFHLLTFAQLEQVQAMQEHGDKAGAAKIVLDAMQSTLSKQTENLGYLEQAWKGVGLAISSAIDWAMKWGQHEPVGDIEKADATLASLKQRQAALQGQLNNSSSLVGKLGLYGQYGAGADAHLALIRSELEMVNGKVRAYQALHNASELFNKTQEKNKALEQDAANIVIGNQSQLTRLKEQQSTLNDAIAAGVGNIAKEKIALSEIEKKIFDIEHPKDRASAAEAKQLLNQIEQIEKAIRPKSDTIFAQMDAQIAALNDGLAKGVIGKDRYLNDLAQVKTAAQDAFKATYQTQDEKAESAFRTEVDRLNEAMKRGWLSAQEYTDALGNARQILNNTSGIKITDPALMSLEDIAKSFVPASQIKDGITLVEDLGRKIADFPKRLTPVQDAFESFGKSIGRSLGNAIAYSRDLGDAVSQVFRQMEAEYIANKIADIFSTIGAAFGKAGNDNWLVNEAASFFTGEPSRNAKGGVYSSPSLSAYSNGVYNSPQTFAFAKGAGVFAEAGPEAIMPLKRGPDGKLGVQAQGGGQNGAGFDMGQAVATLASALTQHITKTSASVSSRAVYKYDRALPTRLGSVSRLGT